MAERDHWDEYQGACEDMIRNTTTNDRWWQVVPGDNMVHPSGGCGRAR